MITTITKNSKTVEIEKQNEKLTAALIELQRRKASPKITLNRLVKDFVDMMEEAYQANLAVDHRGIDEKGKITVLAWVLSSSKYQAMKERVCDESR